MLCTIRDKFWTNHENIQLELHALKQNSADVNITYSMSVFREKSGDKTGSTSANELSKNIDVKTHLLLSVDSH